jgi:enoyl-CoA hydratase/carnithine racemase
LRIAVRKAKFGFPIARTLGNCLSMTNFVRLADLIGMARAKDLIFRARMIEAPLACEAVRLGILQTPAWPEWSAPPGAKERRCVLSRSKPSR